MNKKQSYKIDPQLRMIADGDEKVNTQRADQAPNVAVQRRVLLKEPHLRGADANIVHRSQLKDLSYEDIDSLPDSVYVNVFVQLKENLDELPQALRVFSLPSLRWLLNETVRGGGRLGKKFRRGNLLSLALPLSRLEELANDPDVVAIERPDQIRFSPPIDLKLSKHGPGKIRRIANAPDHKGKVLIGIIDVGGFDFAHPDFLKRADEDQESETRFVRIWDQGGQLRSSPKQFGYGAEITQDQMNAALSAENDPIFGAPATELEPQSQMAVGSHGTHVASIAAGNSGVCRQAYIAAVLISIPEEDEDRRKSFYDSSRIAHAVEYLFDLGEKLSRENGEDVPVSINISLGTNGHAHDGSSATSRWIDHALSTAGRAISVASGNAGQEKAAHPTDWGFVLGRIHTSGRLRKVGDTTEIEWIVYGDGIVDLSENELEVWYSPRDRFAVQLKAPGSEWGPIVEPGKYCENEELSSGTFVSLYNEIYKPSNGLNYIACYLSPLFAEEGVVGVAAGTWKLRLIARDLRDGNYHAWIERDDPHPLGDMGRQQAWFFPSFFSKKTNVDNSSVSSLACGRDVLSVANLDELANKINITSSQGPTREGRHKPEIAAPGTNIVAANGFDPDKHWVSMTGTSMASPYVAGLAGLMLAQNSELTAPQIRAVLHRTAKPLGKSVKWRNNSGYGKIDPEACLEEVKRLALREELEL